MKDLTLKIVAAAVMSVNVACITFLYTNFVPRVEYDHLHEQHLIHVEKYEILKEKVIVQEATLNVYRGIFGDRLD